MGGKGNSRHWKSLAASKYVAVHRKAHGKYYMKPMAGRHSLNSCVPLCDILRKAGFARDAGEAKTAIAMKHILVNGQQVGDYKYPVGISDVVEIVPEKKSLHIAINERGQISISSSGKGEAGERICKVVGKYRNAGNALVIRLHDGRNLPAPEKIKVNDSVVLDAKNSVKKVLPLEKSSACLVIDGVHVGTRGKINSITKGNMHRSASATIISDAGSSFETLVRNLMVVS